MKIGDRVKVMFPPGDLAGVSTVYHLQSKVTVIKSVKLYRKGKSTVFRTYILAGCKSDSGVDFEFVEDWLVPLDDEGVTE